MSLPEQDFSVSKFYFHFHKNTSPNNTFPSVSRIQLFTFINNLIFYSPAFKYHYYEWVSCPFLSKWDNVSQNNTFHSNITSLSGIVPLAFFVQLVIYVCMKSNSSKFEYFCLLTALSMEKVIISNWISAILAFNRSLLC